MPTARLLRYTLYEQPVTVSCEDGGIASTLDAVFGAFASREVAAAPALEYSVRRAAAGGYEVRRPGEPAIPAPHDGVLLYAFEKDLTIELQLRRPDLYFLHAAALERDGRGLLLVAASGSGKSTTAWALLHHGFRYASDELAPIDLATRRVHGFPHALCLKADPPQPYPLPAGTLRTPRTRHVPVSLLPCPLATAPFAADAIVFLQYRPELAQPAIRPIGTAEAGSRLYVQALNALAHPEDGLDAALEIAAGARCYALDTCDLRATCALVEQTLIG